MGTRRCAECMVAEQKRAQGVRQKHLHAACLPGSQASGAGTAENCWQRVRESKTKAAVFSSLHVIGRARARQGPMQG
jgi:hypothetical protein